MEQMSLIAAVKRHLTLPGETLPEISAGYKALTDKDRDDLRAEFAKIGVQIVQIIDKQAAAS